MSLSNEFIEEIKITRRLLNGLDEKKKILFLEDEYLKKCCNELETIRPLNTRPCFQCTFSHITCSNFISPAL